jgi:hypothetical protein
VGNSLSPIWSVLPVPNCPKSLRPQQRVLLLSRTTQVWSPPVPTSRTVSSRATVATVALGISLPPMSRVCPRAQLAIVVAPPTAHAAPI